MKNTAHGEQIASAKKLLNAIASAKQFLSTFNEYYLLLSEKALKSAESAVLLKSESAVLLNSESTVLAAIKMRPAGINLIQVYCNLASLHRSDAATKPEGCDQAISYYKKAKELEKRRFELFEPEIITCYLDFDRCDEAVKSFQESKSRSKESFILQGMQAADAFETAVGFCLSVADEFRSKGKHKHACDTLNLISDEIEGSWKPSWQNNAYTLLSCSSLTHGELRNAIMYAEKVLSVVRKQNDRTNEAVALEYLGVLYERCCKYHAAMAHLQHALAIQKTLKSEDSSQKVLQIYIKIGWVYLNDGAGNEEKALKLFECAISKTQRAFADAGGPLRLVNAFRGMGIAYYDLGKWDHAIEFLKKSLGHCTELTRAERMLSLIYLGSTYIEKYRTLPNKGTQVLANICDELRQDGAFDPNEESEAIYIHIKLLMLGGQRNYAARALKYTFDREMNMRDGNVVRCQCCRQRDGNSVELLKCSGCKVKFYCNRVHQKKNWRGRFFDHKMLCPYLKRWRRVTKGKSTRDYRESIMNDFFDTIESEYSNDNGDSGPREVDC